MATTTLAERFAKSRGEPQDVGGTLVHNIYRRLVAAGEALRVRRIRAVAAPVQGLRVKVDKGTMTVNGRELQDVVLWADSAPSEVELVCHTGKHATGELRVWNCWKERDGVMQAWLGDAGMTIEDGRERVGIRCSDGTHPFEPSDFEVELLFE